MAVAAAAGAIGLAGRGIDFGEPISSRLPFHSYPFAGAALLATVAVPLAGAAVAAWRRHRCTTEWAVGAGAMLVSWIAVEAAVIRTYSWMQPVCAAWGLGVIELGLRVRRRYTATMM